MKICPECGIENNGVDNCTACGAYIGDINEQVESADANNAPEIPECLSPFIVEKQMNGKYIIVKAKSISDMTAEIPDCVEAIKPHAFFGCDLLSVKLNEGLLKIGDRAFANCKDLDTINFPSTLRIIGEEAFSGCSALDVEIPQNVRIGANAFKDTIQDKKAAAQKKDEENQKVEEERKIEAEKNAQITEEEDADFLKSCQIEKGILKKYNGKGGNIRIPDTVKEIKAFAFNDCSTITGVSIPSSVKRIGMYAFKDCRCLSTVNLENGLKDIENSAFKDCSSLSEITIPNSVKDIEKHVFEDCSGLVKINLPSSIKSIGGSAFKGCRALTTVVIPNGVKSIEGKAFEDCSNLKTISISNSVKRIGKGAFAGCTSLTTAKVPPHLIDDFKCELDESVMGKVQFI